MTFPSRPDRKSKSPQQGQTQNPDQVSRLSIEGAGSIGKINYRGSDERRTAFVLTQLVSLSYEDAAETIGCR